jgi:hypothetical protein
MKKYKSVLAALACMAIGAANAQTISPYSLGHPPTNKVEDQTEWLFSGYRHYAYLKFCNEIRQGYAMVYVNDIELDRARTKIKDIEDDSLAVAHDLDTNALWNKAVSSIKGMHADPGTCRATLQGLMMKYPTSHGSVIKLEKDF